QNHITFLGIFPPAKEQPSDRTESREHESVILGALTNGSRTEDQRQRSLRSQKIQGQGKKAENGVEPQEPPEKLECFLASPYDRCEQKIQYDSHEERSPFFIPECFLSCVTQSEAINGKKWQQRRKYFQRSAQRRDGKKATITHGSFVECAPHKIRGEQSINCKLHDVNMTNRQAEHDIFRRSIGSPTIDAEHCEGHDYVNSPLEPDGDHHHVR